MYTLCIVNPATDRHLGNNLKGEVPHFCLLVKLYVPLSPVINAIRDTSCI